jgi:hypothetical protein
LNILLHHNMVGSWSTALTFGLLALGSNASPL